MPISIGAYWLEQPKAKAFREMLPMMGVNGSLANNCKTCPAKGKVFAKTGTVGLSDFVNVGLVDNQSLGGQCSILVVIAGIVAGLIAA